MFCPREEVRESKTIFFSALRSRKGCAGASAAFARVPRRGSGREAGDRGTTGFERIRRHRTFARFGRWPADCEPVSRERAVSGVHSPNDKELPGYFNGDGLYQPIVFQEPFGLVNAEAMACGTPVVGSNAAGT